MKMNRRRHRAYSTDFLNDEFGFLSPKISKSPIGRAKYDKARYPLIRQREFKFPEYQPKQYNDIRTNPKPKVREKYKSGRNKRRTQSLSVQNTKSREEKVLKPTSRHQSTRTLNPSKRKRVKSLLTKPPMDISIVLNKSKLIQQVTHVPQPPPVPKQKPKVSNTQHHDIIVSPPVHPVRPVKHALPVVPVASKKKSNKSKAQRKSKGKKKKTKCQGNIVSIKLFEPDAVADHKPIQTGLADEVLSLQKQMILMSMEDVDDKTSDANKCIVTSNNDTNFIRKTEDDKGVAANDNDGLSDSKLIVFKPHTEDEDKQIQTVFADDNTNKEGDPFGRNHVAIAAANDKDKDDTDELADLKLIVRKKENEFGACGEGTKRRRRISQQEMEKQLQAEEEEYKMRMLAIRQMRERLINKRPNGFEEQRLWSSQGGEGSGGWQFKWSFDFSSLGFNLNWV
eukprot:448819_1